MSAGPGGKRQLGAAGESCAVEHLLRNGYVILERNYRTPLGEVDVVAEEAGTLVFAEVKTRSGLGLGLPREAVGRRKQQRMTRAAFRYLSEHAEERPCRFDVVEVLVLAGRVVDVHVIRDAFQPDEHDLTC